MSLFKTNLATQGIDKLNRYRILQRHLLAFLKHMTLVKMLNFMRTEFNMATKKSHLSSYPYILKIESTNICNLQCKYCYDDRRASQENERPYGKMTFLQFRKIIDELAPYLFKINLYGYGEPFLFPETIEMIQYAMDNNIGMAISSNLNIEDNDQFAEKIVSSGLEVLIFSCHGVSEKSYKEFTRKGNLKLALNNISRIVEARKKLDSKTPFIDWQYCVTRFNEGEIEEAKIIAKNLGIDQIRFIKPNLPEGAEKSWHSKLFPHRSHHRPALPPRSCSWFYRAAYINQDGGVLPCCRDMRLVENNYGNVFEEPFEKIWNNDKYVTSRGLVTKDLDAPVPCKTMCHECPVFNKDVDR